MLHDNQRISIPIPHDLRLVLFKHVRGPFMPKTVLQYESQVEFNIPLGVNRENPQPPTFYRGNPKGDNLTMNFLGTLLDLYNLDLSAPSHRCFCQRARLVSSKPLRELPKRPQKAPTPQHRKLPKKIFRQKFQWPVPVKAVLVGGFPLHKPYI